MWPLKNTSFWCSLWAIHKTLTKILGCKICTMIWFFSFILLGVHRLLTSVAWSLQLILIHTSNYLFKYYICLIFLSSPAIPTTKFKFSHFIIYMRSLLYFFLFLLPINVAVYEFLLHLCCVSSEKPSFDSLSNDIIVFCYNFFILKNSLLFSPKNSHFFSKLGRKLSYFKVCLYDLEHFINLFLSSSFLLCHSWCLFSSCAHFLFNVRHYICKIVETTQDLGFHFSSERNYDVFVRYLDELAIWVTSIPKIKMIQIWAVVPAKVYLLLVYLYFKGVVSQIPTKSNGYSQGWDLDSNP